MATPLLWRGLRQRSRKPRILLTTGGSLVLAGGTGAVLEGIHPGRNEAMSIVVPVLVVLAQLLVLPLLLFLSRKRTPG